MSGLVTGLQNRAQRFESACDLKTLGADSIGVSAFFSELEALESLDVLEN